MASETPKYTTILHEIRIALGLSVLEYCVADTINRLSTNTKSKIPGWCYASKVFLGKGLGITEQGVHKILNKLILKGIVEKDDETKYIRTTQIWYDNVVVINTKQSLATLNEVEPHETKLPTKQSLATDTKQSLVNNNNIDNNKEEIGAKAPARGAGVGGGGKEIKPKSVSQVLSELKAPHDVELDKENDIPVEQEKEFIVKEKKKKEPKTPEEIEENKKIGALIGIFSDINATIKNEDKNFYGREVQRNACRYLFKQYGYQGALDLAKKVVELRGQKGAPIITTPLSLKEKLADLQIYLGRQEAQPKGRQIGIGKDHTKS